MGEPRDIDELLAGARRVEAESHTARRAIGLGTALIATGATVAFIVLGTARGLLLTVASFVWAIWPS